MKFWIIKPKGFLEKYIKDFCIMESFLSKEIITERVFPDTCIQLMFHYKNPFRVHLADGLYRQQPNSILSGLSNSFLDVSTNGETGVVFVRLYPAGISSFFHFPLREIENFSIDLKDIYPEMTIKIEEQLYFEKTIQGKCRIIEEYLMSLYIPMEKFDFQFIYSAEKLIHEKKGQISVLELSDKLSVSTKSLERKFLVNIGKTPKQYIKIIRFQKILNHFMTHKNISLTEHAYLNGYFDQSHFIKDFKKITGLTPKEFLRRYPEYALNES